MKDIRVRRENTGEVFTSKTAKNTAPVDLSREYAEVNILRRAYELILENSDTFFMELEKSFIIEREKRESNLLI